MADEPMPRDLQPGAPPVRAHATGQPASWVFGVRAKLALLVLVVALVPPAVLAATTLRVHEQVLDENADALDLRAATDGANRAAAALDGFVRGVKLLAVDTMRWDRLSPRERTGALWLLYGQSNDVVATTFSSMHDAADGARVYLEGEAATRSARISANTAVLEAMGQALQGVRGAQLGEVVVGEHSWVEALPEAILPVMAVVAGSSARSPHVVTLALSLRSVCATVADVETGAIAVALLDAKGRRLCRHGTTLPESIRGALTNVEVATIESILAARANVGPPWGTGWQVIAQQPTTVAYATSQRMREQTLYWAIASLIAALLAGVVLAQSISAPIARLATATRDLAHGRFNHRLPVHGGGELARLAASFNHMSGEIARRDKEIRGFNTELQRRVEQRSLELTDANMKLQQSQRIAAVSTLGAGVAHEINNPLTGVLTLSQILLEEVKHDAARGDLVEPLTEVVNNGERIRDIVKRLGQLAAHQSGGGGEPIQLADVIDATVRMLTPELKSRHVEWSPHERGLPGTWGDPAKRSQVLLEIMKNAITATAPGGRLTLRCAGFDADYVRISISDDGRGIEGPRLESIFHPFDTAKDDWTSQGLGLAIAYRIVEIHGGRLTAESELGVGTTVHVDLPIAEPMVLETAAIAASAAHASRSAAPC